MSKKELIDRLKKAESQSGEPQAPPKEKIQIRNRYTDEVIYESETATTIKEAVEEANLSKANLYNADLYKANLSKANLYNANLYKANLSKANLYNANLSKANLSKANLSKANLYNANLSKANLYKANLVYCKMDKKVFKQITEEWFEWGVSDD